MAGTVEFGLLGPLLVRSGGTEVVVRRGHQRALLACLLVNANRPVPVGAIADVLWGGMPPPSAPVTVRNYVRRLRHALSQAGVERISTQPRGYLIRVTDGELDLARFERLLAAAQAAARRGAWMEVAAQSAAALALWRGEALSDVESDTLIASEVPRLAELRLEAVETRIDAELRLGHHGAVVAELQQLAAAHPLREHLHALLMLALYRAARQGEALGAYRRIRSTVVDELGTEPGVELQLMHQRILAADPELSRPKPAAVIEPDGAPAAGYTEGAGDTRRAAGRPAAGVPHQLPPALACFTGRDTELSALARILQAPGTAPGTVLISAVGGAAGVGKTALALRWAHQIADQFTDGQLYLNLHGYDASGSSTTVTAALCAFLDALGVPPDRIPPDPDSQVALYRSMLAGRRMLILLDNARDEQQVRPLLPATLGCLVLVTSRRQLTGLATTDGARLLTVDVLPPADAHRLLATRVGTGSAAGEQAAINEIARLCGYLPLALAVAAARAADRPELPLAALAGELRDVEGRLDALDTGDPFASVRSVFSWSVRQLRPTAASLFTLLGLHPGGDIAVAAAASLAGVQPDQARRDLRELVRAHLLSELTPGRYTCHDLLHAYAAELAHAAGSEPERTAATGRMLGYYLHTAVGADRLLQPTREPIALGPPPAGSSPESISDLGAASQWYRQEHANVLAAIAYAARAGHDVHAWRLAWAMAGYLERGGHWHEQLDAHHTGLDAARRLGDPAAAAYAHRVLGRAYTGLRLYPEATVHLRQAVELHERLGDTSGLAAAHRGLAWVYERQGRIGPATGHAREAVRLFRLAGDHGGLATALNALGWVHARAGKFHEAVVACRLSLHLHHRHQVGDLAGEANTWESLGYAYHNLGRHGEAIDCYQRALPLMREQGQRYFEADTLAHLGTTYEEIGNPAAALRCRWEALTILEDLGHPDAGRMRRKVQGKGEER